MDLHRRQGGKLAPLAGSVLVALGLSGSCGKDKSTNPASIPSIASSMVLVHPGQFLMGSPDNEPGRQTDETPHTVTMRRPFYILRHEVTQTEWRGLMGQDPSFFPGSDSPVDNVSWIDAVRFCNALSAAEGLASAYTFAPDSVAWDTAAAGYRLPTEAEWEYACRADSFSAFADGPILNPGDNCAPDANLERMAWYCANYGNASHGVMRKAANSWGLFDMHGNVWEWCWDWYGTYPDTAVADPRGPVKPGTDSLRVLRGGSWGSEARFCRSAVRWSGKMRQVENSCGFRLARNAPPDSARRRGSPS